MKNLRIVVILIFVMLLSGKNDASAQTRKMNSASPHRGSVLQNKSGEEKVKKVNLSPVPMDQFSYAYGMVAPLFYSVSFTLDSIELKDFIDGYKDYRMTPADQKAHRKAYNIGIRTGRDLQACYNRIFKSSIADSEKKALINAELFQKGFFDYLESDTLPLDSATQFVAKYKVYLDSLSGSDAEGHVQDDNQTISKSSPEGKMNAANHAVPLDSVTIAQLSYALGITYSDSIDLTFEVGYVYQYEGEKDQIYQLDTVALNNLEQGYAAYIEASPQEAKRLVASSNGFIRAYDVIRRIDYLNSKFKFITDHPKDEYVNIARVIDGYLDLLQRTNKISMREAIETVNRQRSYLTLRIKKRDAAFLSSFRKLKGVKSLGSDVHYRVIKKGHGKTPKYKSQVVFTSETYSINGTKSDEFEPLTPHTDYVKNFDWQFKQVLLQMRVGSTAEIVAPEYFWGDDLLYIPDTPTYTPLGITKIKLLGIIKQKR